jgi:hypothetical protein
MAAAVLRIIVRDVCWVYAAGRRGELVIQERELGVVARALGPQLEELRVRRADLVGAPLP